MPHQDELISAPDGLHNAPVSVLAMQIGCPPDGGLPLRRNSLASRGWNRIGLLASAPAVPPKRGASFVAACNQGG